MRVGWRVLGILVLALGMASAAFADQTDIGFVSTTTNFVPNTTTVTVNAVPVSGLNRVLMVGISLANGVSKTNLVQYNVGSGNVSLTRVASQVSPANNTKAEIWDLVNPTVGTTGTLTISSITGGSTDVIVGVMCWTNVNQATPVVLSGTAQATSNLPTLTLAASGVSRSAFFSVLAMDDPTSNNVITLPNTIATQAWSLVTSGGSGGGIVEGISSNQPGDTRNVSFSSVQSHAWALAVAELQNIPGKPTAAHYTTARAAPEGSHVRLRWRTAFEKENLGYRVHKEDAAGRRQITTDLIAGTALFMSRAQIEHGRSYVFDDPEPINLQARYFIEDVDVHGKRTWFGPVAVDTSAAAVKALAADLTPSSTRLLSRLGAKNRRSRGNAIADGPAPTSGVSMGLAPFVGASARPLAPAFARQRQLAGRVALKLRVNGGGWFRVTRDELVAAGLPASLDPRSLQMFEDGREICIGLRQADPKRFASGDVIEFYGTGLDTNATDTRVYWLLWGTENGARLTRSNAAGNTKSAAANFPYAVERHDRNLYVSTVHNGDADNFYGPVVMGSAVDQLIGVPNPDTTTAGAQATVTVAMQGFSDNHAVAVALNGRPLGVMQWTGQDRKSTTFTVPATALINGDNTLRLTGASDEDVTAVENLRIDYPHAFTADADVLTFTMRGAANQVIRGFTNNRLRVLDVTDTTSVRELVPTILHDSAGYAISVSPTGTGQRTLIAFSDDRAAKVNAIDLNRPSALVDRANQGAVLFISHRNFAAALEPLRARRAGQFGSSMIVDVDDVYDEFSFGSKSPDAIRDFLTAAADWRVPPRYVVLVGDATFDPRNYTQDGLDGSLDFDFVPTRIVDTAEFETASDDFYTDRDGDGAADVPIGRLPVRTADEATTIVNKLLAYEATPNDPSWMTKAIFVSDTNDDKSNFDANAAFGAGGLSAPFTIQQLSVNALSAGPVRTQLLNGINSGASLVTFFGHASQEQWSESGLLFGEDAAGFTGAPKLPVVVGMTCLTGLFHDLFVDCMAKKFLRAPNGPVAYWGCTGFCEAEPQPALCRAFLRAITTAPRATLGDAAVAAKRANANRDVRVTWTLFGDPSMKLR